jgi:CO dehydrogenase/acetyl-CoA synthase beta subunit
MFAHGVIFNVKYKNCRPNEKISLKSMKKISKIACGCFESIYLKQPNQANV